MNTTESPLSLAANAARHLTDASRNHTDPAEAQADALIAIGYALVALYEQAERRPEPAPARRWWQRGAR